MVLRWRSHWCRPVADACATPDNQPPGRSCSRPAIRGVRFRARISPAAFWPGRIGYRRAPPRAFPQRVLTSSIYTEPNGTPSGGIPWPTMDRTSIMSRPSCIRNCSRLFRHGEINPGRDYRSRRSGAKGGRSRCRGHGALKRRTGTTMRFNCGAAKIPPIRKRATRG